MSYFEDLSIYTYHHSTFYSTGTKNIGWLGLGHPFPTWTPTDEILDLIWTYCKISVAQMRGIHECEFCPRGDWYISERSGQKLLLGTSEIRVFSKDGDTYAAPTLVYHYVCVHHYKPPDEFLRALAEGPRPPSQEYFELLEKAGLEWRNTSVPDGKLVGRRL